MQLWPVQSIAGEACNYSCRAFPLDIPLHVTVAAVRPDECVVHISYNRPSSAAPSHRFFSVKLADLSVIALNDGYCPAEWALPSPPL